MLSLLFMLGCNTYHGKIIEKYYQSDGIGIGNSINPSNGQVGVVTTYIPATYNILISTPSNGKHMISVNKEYWLNCQIGDTLTFKD
jgi:ABC-type transport system involved in cytochrome c biogenesis permease subunit